MALGRRRRARDDGEGRTAAVGGAAAAGGAAFLRILAMIVDVLVGIVCVLIVLGIIFVIFKANPKNGIVKDVHDAAKFLVGPFDGLFTPKDHKLAIAINWGIAAAVYLLVGRLIASLLRRPARAVGD
jgi:hypothetical protein